MSASMPVVSQSIMKLMVPVGASTGAGAFLQPDCAPMVRQERQVWRGASRVESGRLEGRSAGAGGCIDIASGVASLLAAKRANGPICTLAAVAVEQAYASPCSMAMSA